MKKIKTAIALFLVLLNILALAACGGSGEGLNSGSGSETEALTDGENTAAIATGINGSFAIGDLNSDISPYLKEHSDYEAAKKWYEENIISAEVPPVDFIMGGKTAKDLSWTKEIGEATMHTDFPDSGDPVNRTSFEIRYTCEKYKLEVVLTVTTYPDYPVVEYDAEIINLAKKNSDKIMDVRAINGAIGAYTEGTLIHYNDGGRYSSDAFRPYTEEIISGRKFKLETVDGLPSDSFMPYFNIENKAESKGVVAVIDWQGSWTMECTAKGGNVIFEAGQRETFFSLREGESYNAPGMMLLFYKNGDWQYGQNVWRRWLVEHNLMRNTGTREFKENVYLCSGFPGTATDISAIKLVGTTRIPKKFNSVFTYDAGWYNSYGDSWTHTGDWSPNEKYADGGLVRVGEAAKNAGIKYCFWLEPERVYTGTPQAEDLGDNMIYRYDGKYVTKKEYESLTDDTKSILLNYSKKESVDYVVKLIDTTVNTYGLDVYRQDFNTENDKYWDAYDTYEADLYGIPRTGMTESLSCKGYIDAWTQIAEKNPGLVFDACAGGGRRLDLSTLRFSFAHTKTDYWMDIVSQQCQNFGAYSWLIYTGTGFTEMSTYDIRTRLTLSIGVGCAPTTDFKLLESCLDEWQSLHKYMYNDFYQISELDTSETGTLAMEFTDSDKGEGMMIAYLRIGGVYDLVAKGLDPQKNYRVWDGDDPDSERIMSGKQLMTEGFTVAYPYTAPYAAVVWFEESDKDPTAFDREAFIKASGLTDFSSFIPVINDEDTLVKLYKESDISDNGVVFLSSDYDSSGGIYGIGKELYSSFVRNGEKNAEGWEMLDPEKTFIYVNGIMQTDLAGIGTGTRYNVKAYVKEKDGCYLLWLDDSYSLGDIDGGWEDDVRCIGSSKNGDVILSDEFLFEVSSYKEIENREVTYVSVDMTDSGGIYSLSERIYNTLPLAGKTRKMYGYEWKLVDMSTSYFEINRDPEKHDDSYIRIYGEYLGATLAVDVYVAEKDGKYYMWMKNTAALSDSVVSDRVEWYIANEGNLYKTEFYLSVKDSSKENVPSLPNVLDLW
ncbi:MAG: alpha-galactosidase [Ruminococcaceae bacterium]|nr:alpha-galactosidase [Oscillospiraceae bacterium]